MKRSTVLTLSVTLGLAGYLASTTCFATAPSVVAKAPSPYSGKIYVAGMGGHFATADIEIDPAAEHPILIKGLDKIDIGNKDTHPTHDARLDSNDPQKLLWSTYKLDKGIEGRGVHVGATDLKTGKVLKDVAVQVPERAGLTAAVYCSSGQSKTAYLLATMTNEGYISVFDKATLALKQQIFVDSLGYKNNYQYLHGSNSPDMKTYVLAINKTKEWQKADTPAERLGSIDMLMLDLPELEKGNLKVLAKNTLTGSPKTTITFRQSFTVDGKYIVQSAADRLYLLNAADMSLIDEEMMTDGENHEALPTPDGRYAIITIRTDMSVKEGEKLKDGALQLYDIQEKKLVGKPTSVCYACHKDAVAADQPMWNSILCGADARWN